MNYRNAALKSDAAWKRHQIERRAWIAFDDLVFISEAPFINLSRAQMNGLRSTIRRLWNR